MSISKMQNALKAYLNSKAQQTTDTTDHYAMQGVLSGDKVYIDGYPYPYDMAVDYLPVDGSAVYCVYTSDKNAVIVVGC